MEHSGSLLRKLQLGFALVAFLLTGFMALFMDVALRRALEAEDAVVMRAQADNLARRTLTGEWPIHTPVMPEKSEWRILAASGEVLRESPDLRLLGPIVWSGPANGPVHVKGSRGQPLTLLTRHLPDGALLQMAMDRSHEREMIDEFRRALLLVTATAAVVAALAGGWVARRGLAPLRRIVAEAGHIHPLRLEHRLDPGHFPRELAELVATLNGALDRIQASFEGLSRFAGELSHELRTPLQNLRGEVEALQRNPAHFEEALGSILDECDRMAELMEKTLFLARTEDPAAALEREPLELAPLLHELASFFEASAEEAGLRIEVEAPPGLRLRADRRLLERALTNLLTNALRHTPQGGWIRVSAQPEEAATLICVQDSGPGVDPGLMARLGQPWARGDHREGHGLGLAIVKGILRLHEGTAVFASEPGEGLKVELRFPAKAWRGASASRVIPSSDRRP